MLKTRKIFIITIFLLSFSAFAKAQEIPYYLFLETVDSQNKPIEGAKLSFPSYNWRDKTEKENWGWEVQTGADGKVKTYVPNHGYQFAGRLFRVIKSGYYPFTDLGTKLNPFDNFYRTCLQFLH
jgi:hypothetical protein